MFWTLKEELEGHRFNDDDVVDTFVWNWLQWRSDSFTDDGIKKLPIRWEKCVNKRGDYTEK